MHGTAAKNYVKRCDDVVVIDLSKIDKHDK